MEVPEASFPPAPARSSGRPDSLPPSVRQPTTLVRMQGFGAAHSDIVIPMNIQKMSVSLRPRPDQGFTLVELMVTLSLVVVLVLMAVPSMTTIIQNNRLAAAANEMLLSLNLARGAAVEHGANAAVCLSGGCESDSGEWELGWIVFVDGDNDRSLSATPDANGNGLWDMGEDLLLSSQGPLDGGLTLRGNSSVDSMIRYNPEGIIAGVGGTLILCDSSQELGSARRIIVNNTGRARVETGSGDSASCSNP